MSSAEEIIRKKIGGVKGRKREIEEVRKKWRERGPVWFAENVLRCYPEVPPHPDLGRVPKFNILPEEQKRFLTDLEITFKLKRTFRGALTAGRGAGKTYCIGIFVCWVICSYDWVECTIIGGSSKQSMEIQKYIDFWRISDDIVGFCLFKSSRGSGKTPAYVKSRWNAYSEFPACSPSAARGPHRRIIIIDETAAAEARDSTSRQAVRDVRWQRTGREGTIFLMTSTSQYAYGMFGNVLKNPEKLGFKIYRWSIARHISKNWNKPDGTPNWDYIDSYLVKDRNPANWIPNQWWHTKDDIEALRNGSTDEEWLVEALGGIGRGSGTIYSRNDLSICVCDGTMVAGKKCKTCKPWNPDTCPLMEKLEMRNIAEATQRTGGADFGEVAALTIVGKYDTYLLILYSDERQYLGATGTLNWMKETIKDWLVYTVVADPEERGMCEALEYQGLVVINPWALGGGGKKALLVTNSQRWIEKHKVIIPIKFRKLIDSMSGMIFKAGKPVKHNDHSWDSLIYALSEFPIDSGLDQFFEATKGTVLKTIW